MAVDEEEKIENATTEYETRGHNIVDKCLRIMSSYAKEICFILSVLFTVYAALQSGPLKTQKVAIPKRFFPLNSLVTDYYLGSIQIAFDRISESDLTFVMYYATWDAASMAVRWEFDKTATYFHNEIEFIAVNCWWPDGECHQHFKKIHSFPVLMAYSGTHRGIQYRGPYQSGYMFVFLEKLRNPLRPIYNLDDVVDLQVRHDTVVIAFFEFDRGRQPSGFDAYYNTALRALERDPSQKIIFAVATDKKVANILGLRKCKDVILLRFNQSVAYDPETNNDKVLHWSIQHRKPAAQWLHLPLTKSLLLSSVLEKSSPAMILFTPQNPLVDINLYYNLLNEIAMDYYNCNDSSLVRQLVSHSTYVSARQRATHNQMDKSCHRTIKTPLSQEKCCKSVAVQQISKVIDSQRQCDVCLLPRKDSNWCYIETNLQWLYKVENSCRNFQNNYDPNSTFSACCMDVTSETSLDEHVNLKCKKELIAQFYEQNDLPYLDRSDDPVISISGLGCRTNRSLSFAAIDSVRFEVVANSAGINLKNLGQRTAVLIQHSQEEAQYLMHGRISRNRLREFILNFTHNRLQRFLKTGQTGERKNCNADDVCLLEVTSSQFVKRVLQSEKDVIVFYYTHWCGFCLASFHIFLEAAFYFKNVPDLTFARINGDTNDLPWEFTVDKYPTILFFPAERKMESRAFPQELPVTLSNLIGFILANAGFSNRLKLAINLCSNRMCLLKNRRLVAMHEQTVLADVRELMIRLTQASTFLRKKKNDKDNPMNDYKKYIIDQLDRKLIELKHSKKLRLVLSTSEINHALIYKWQQEFLKSKNQVMTK